MARNKKTSTEYISFKRRLSLSIRMLTTAWQIRAGSVCGFFVGAALEIAGSILTIYASAQLASLLAAFVAGRAAQGIWFWLYIDIAAAAIIALGFFIMSYTRRLLYFSFVRWSTMTYMATICRLDLQDYYAKATRNEINKVSGSYTWQLSVLAETNLDLIYGTLRFIAITVVVSQITWWLVPLIALFLVPTLFAESRLAQLQWFVWDEKGDQRHIFWGLDWIMRQAKGQMELRSLQASKFVMGKVQSMNDEFYNAQESKFRSANVLVLPTKLLEVGGTAVGSIVLLRQLLGGVIGLDRYFFLSGALFRISGALNNVFGTVSRMQESLLYANSYFNLVDTTPKIIDPSDAVMLPSAVTPDIIFEAVSFSYPGRVKPVFENLNLHIAAGEHVALVGENGAGKSTLIKLLMRFYKPTAGRILIGGIDLQQLAIESWYSQIATLFQDFNQYPLPIDENITIGRSSKQPNPALLASAAKFGGVDQLVAGYTYGWDTVLDSSFKKGTEPSGGQWQRVAIARAFYRNANVLILDEPTSAIDAQAEYHIFNSIFQEYQQKTAIIVSHRFSTVRRADRIIVINHGTIVEEGTHEALLMSKGAYHDLFTKQAEGYQ